MKTDSKTNEVMASYEKANYNLAREYNKKITALRNQMKDLSKPSVDKFNTELARLKDKLDENKAILQEQLTSLLKSIPTTPDSSPQYDKVIKDYEMESNKLMASYRSEVAILRKELNAIRVPLIKDFNNSRKELSDKLSIDKIIG